VRKVIICLFIVGLMTLNSVYISPHGDELITKPNKESTILSESLHDLAIKDRADTIVVISPHGLRLGKSVSVLTTDYFSGYLKLRKTIIRKKFKNEKALALRIIDNAPLAEEASFITSSGPKSIFPLDFGSLIPLYFFKKERIVMMGQPRLWLLDDLEYFGKCLFHEIESFPKEISVIFSADQAHTHSSKGPYGYSKDSRIYEDLIESCVVFNDFNKLKSLQRSFIENAKPDSFWNMIILKGFLKEGGLKLSLDYHYVENYFGMLLAHASAKGF